LIRQWNSWGIANNKFTGDWDGPTPLERCNLMLTGTKDEKLIPSIAYGRMPIFCVAVKVESAITTVTVILTLLPEAPAHQSSLKVL
jgi:hypothetical protein